MDDEELKANKEAIEIAAKKSLLYLSKILLNYSDLTQYTHGRIIQALESQKPRKLVVCPRGSFKSSLCVISYSIWRLIKNPNERILIDSELYVNSKNFLKEIKGHLESDLLESVFGRFVTRGNWTEGSVTIAQRTKVYKEASITCSGIGAEKTGQHYSVIIIDDANSPKNSQTPEMRSKVIDHWRYTQSILDPGGTLVVVGTRYAEDDLLGHIMHTEGLEI